LCLLLATVGVWYQLPLRAALAVSRPAMDRLAHDQINSTNPYLDDRWVGVYHATRAKQVPGGMRFTVEEQDRAYKAGFTYLPRVNPNQMRGRNNRSFRPLGHGWWAWREEG
jgi:hypothetical protein